MPMLLGSIDQAREMYGEATMAEPYEDFPEATTHSFQPNRFFQINVTEWHGKIHSIVFWSDRPDPVADLRCVMDRYGERRGWRCMEAGYWYVRNDDQVYLWCSAIPAIGLSSLDFREAKSRFKARAITERVIAKSQSHDGWEMGDVHWTPNEEIEELQRLAILGQREPLQRFVESSPFIAASEGAEDVFVVRRHRAFVFEGGFTETNQPPDDAEGPSTQVINVFSRTETGATWGKIPLPRNAEVQSIKCERDSIELRITRRDDEMMFAVRDIWRLKLFRPGGYCEEEMWQRIQEIAETI